MGLPTSRDITFTPNSPIPSAFLNNVQDQIIANNTRFVSTDVIPASRGAQENDATQRWKVTSGWVEDVSSSGIWWVPIARKKGDTVSAVRCIVAPFSGANTGEIAATFIRYTGVTPTTLAGPTGNPSGGTGALQTITLSFTASRSTRRRRTIVLTCVRNGCIVWT